MDKNTVLNILSQFKLLLEREGVPVERMVLYGSYAAGTQVESSDIDVVVVSPSFRGLDLWQRSGRVAAALYELLAPIETRLLTPEEWDHNGSLAATYAKSCAHLMV